VPCPERDRLVEAFFAAVEVYRKAVAELKGSLASDSLYGLQRADQARQRCEHYRTELRRHDAEHNCYLLPETKTLPLKDD